MVAKFNGKTKTKAPAALPSGTKVKQQAKKIESPASKAKQRGGSANIGYAG